MNSPILICDGCGLKSDVIEQLCGHYYCKQCVSNSILSGELICNLHLEEENEEEIDDFTILDEASCPHCESVLDLENAQDHNDNCDKRPIDCPKCEKKYPRGQMAIHIEKCEQNVHQCSFSQLGCHYQESPAEVEEHQNDKKIHFKLMTNSLINFRTQSELCEENLRDGNFRKSNECCSNAKSMHEDLQKQIEKQNVENDLYKQRIAQLELEQNKTALQLTEANKKLQVLIGINQVAEETCQEQPDKINLRLDNTLGSSEDETMLNLNNINEKLKVISVENSKREENNNLDLKLEEVKTSIAKYIGSLRNEAHVAIWKSSAKMNQTLDLLDLKLGIVTKHLESFNARWNAVVNRQQLHLPASNVFEYCIKLEMFSVHQVEAKEKPTYGAKSAPFYNSPLGYKMRLIIFPNGCGKAKDTHLSVYIQIMKGINDDFLKWPLLYKATIALLDPSDPKKQYANRMEPKFDTENMGKFLSKPVDQYNNPLGLAKFISLDELTDKYLQNDTMYLKLSITV